LFPCMHVESQIQRECLFLPVPYSVTFGSAVELSQLPDLSLISLIGILQNSPWQIYGIYSLFLMHTQIARRQQRLIYH